MNKYKPKCACGTQLVDGVCPEGCNNYKKPAQVIRLSERGRKPESRIGWLTPREIDRGMATAMSKTKRRS